MTTQWPPWPEGFIGAHPDEIDDELVEHGPVGRPTVRIQQMDPVKVATLGAIIGAGSYDELVSAMIAQSRDAESGECGLFPVPTSIRDGLAKLDDAHAVVDAWLETDELRLDRWSKEDTMDLVHRLTQLARRAQTEGEELFVWWSL